MKRGGCMRAWGMAMIATVLLALPSTLIATNPNLTAYQQQVIPLLREASSHTENAMQAASVATKDTMIIELEQALTYANQAQEFGYNERLHDAVYALADALHHGQAGELQDAYHHLEQARHALRHAARLTTPDPLEGIPPTYERLSTEDRAKLDGALHRVHGADLNADRGDTEAARRELEKAIQQIQPIAKEDWRLKDALKGLREAQGHLQHNEIRDVKEHLQYAIMKLLEVRGR